MLAAGFAIAGACLFTQCTPSQKSFAGGNREWRFRRHAFDQHMANARIMAMDSANSLGLRKIAREDGGPEGLSGDYKALLARLAAKFRNCSSEEDYAREALALTRGLSRGYGQNEWGFLSESLRTGRYDCENLCTIFFDLFNAMGLQPSIAFTKVQGNVADSHVLLLFGSMALEPDAGICYPRQELAGRHPNIYLVSRDISALDLLPLTNMARKAWLDQDKGNDSLARIYGDLALSLAPTIPDLHRNAGIYNSNFDTARSRLESGFNDRLLAGGTFDSEMAFVLGQAFMDEKLYGQAAKMLIEACAQDPGNFAAYRLLLEAFARLGYTNVLFHGTTSSEPFQDIDLGNGAALELTHSHRSWIDATLRIGSARGAKYEAVLPKVGGWKEYGGYIVVHMNSKYAKYPLDPMIPGGEPGATLLILSKAGSGENAHLMNSP
jgi:hypothetical protein